MRFYVRYIVGKNCLRNRIISAKDLDDAEEKCNKKIKKWTDISMMDISKAVEAYEQ